MKIQPGNSTRRSARSGGFSLVESAIGMAVVGVMFTSFFAGLSQSLSIVQSARETLRATQVMTEKMDTIRLYKWSDLIASGYVPKSFQVPFDAVTNTGAAKQAGATNSGPVYQGTITIKAPPVTESYSNTLREITITLNWQSGKFKRQAQMSTWVSQYGIQNYIYR